MKHYRRLWQESPGAMTLLHVVATGLTVSVALVGRNPLASLAALGITCLMAACLMAACAAWDLTK